MNTGTSQKQFQWLRIQSIKDAVHIDIKTNKPVSRESAV